MERAQFPNAMPEEWTKHKFSLIEERKLHPKRTVGRVITRRYVTGERIARNILAFNSPVVPRN